MFFTLALLLLKRGSVASSGFFRTWEQNRAHSRSFWIAIMTLDPSLTEKAA